MLNFNYSEYQDAGRLGQLTDTEDVNLITRIAEVDGIPFACPLEFGDATVAGPGHLNVDNTEGAAAKPFDGGQFIGISVRQRNIEVGDVYSKGEHIRMATNYGAIWVEVKGPVAVGDKVFIDAGATQFGNAGATQIPALFETSAAAAGELAVIRLQSILP